MDRFSIPMWQSDRSKLLLANVLKAFPENEWTWSVLAFDGVGPGPEGMSWQEFDKLLHALPNGYSLSWSELKDFASHLEDVHFFLAVAVSSVNKLDAERLAQNDFTGCVAALEAFDSTEWTVSLKDGQAFRPNCLSDSF